MSWTIGWLSVCMVAGTKRPHNKQFRELGRGGQGELPAHLWAEARREGRAGS